MTTTSTRLVLIPYLQSWDGSTLKIRLLSVPRYSPIDHLVPQSPTSFAEAHFKFDVYFDSDINTLPQPGGVALMTLDSPAPLNGVKIFNALAEQYPIDPTPSTANKKPIGSVVKKHLPQSYRDAVNYASGRSRARVYTDDTYSCMMSQNTGKYKPLPPPNPKIAWGRVIAILLRNPSFALAAGLIRPFDIHFNDPSILKDGGYLYLTLSRTSEAAGLLRNDGLKVYATRIPPLTTTRDLFSPVFFPVVSPPPSANYADIFAEVEDYDDGWAKAVHCYQVQYLDHLSDKDDGSRPSRDLGIRIGWDDEQVTVWMNRQLDANEDFDSPLGVQGYRVDARLQGTTEWFSLVHATGSVQLANMNPIPFDGELNVEVHPVQQDALKQGDFWLPSYFTSWSGRTLVSADETLSLLSGGPDLSSKQKVRGTAPKIDLRYGKNYSIRVRLADHTGGGPSSSDNPITPGPSPVANINFRRWIRPLSPALISPTMDELKKPIDFGHPIMFFEVQRPLMHYPAVLFTGHYSARELIDDVPKAIAEKREPGLVDPDVSSVRITVEVAALHQDPLASDGGFMPLFDLSRSFPADISTKLHIDIVWKDVQQVSDLQGMNTPGGSIVLPRGRTIRLRIVSECQPRPEYYGAEDVRYGTGVQIELGSFASSETQLFVPALPAKSITGFFFQPDQITDPTLKTAQQAAGDLRQAPSDITSRCAVAFELQNTGLTYFAPPGRRTVFGCAGSINHTILPNLASITFTSSHDLTLHWLVLIRLTLNRDWSWDGFMPEGISVQRDGVEVGRFAPNRNLDVKTLQQPIRTSTDLIFFDIIDPKAPSNGFPQELSPQYKIVCSLQGSPATDPPQNLHIRLPVTTPPTQVPKLQSVGIAMSPYVHPPDYSSSEARTRFLWLEFDSPPLDPRDRFFARVLRNAPDPLLSDLGDLVTTTLEPPLPIDSELVRKVVPGEATDAAGLTVMQTLVKSDSDLHYLLPLPPGVTSTSPELFGFWTYEFRVGHAGMWCTAKGRFGPPLRVAGIQHPPPVLTCSVQRNKSELIVTAPFAAPVFDGSNVQPSQYPKSRLWAMLYAQAALLDGNGEWSNVLITRKEMLFIDSTGSGLKREVALASLAYGKALINVGDYSKTLMSLGFAEDAPLSVLAVEMMPQDEMPPSPLGANLGGQRILRSSALVAVPVIC